MDGRGFEYRDSIMALAKFFYSGSVSFKGLKERLTRLAHLGAEDL